MIAVRLVLKLNQAPLKRVPIPLTNAHWEVNRFRRSRFAVGGFQASARDGVQQFRRAWDAEPGSHHQLDQLFPRGGPQKQGNRRAGLLRTKGEH